MKIGVDASLLAGPITGIGRYTHELLKRVVNSEHEWYLYSNRPIFSDYIQRKNVHLRVFNAPNMVPKLLSTMATTTFFANRDKIELFWSPTHRLPFFLPKRIARVLTIHDLTWKHASETMKPLNRLIDSTLMPQGIKIADRIIAVSMHTAADLSAEFPASASKIRITPLGVTIKNHDTSFIDNSALNLNNPFILFVGTLEPRKNLARLVEAFSLLPSSLKSSISLVVAGGEGWGGVDIRSLAVKFGVQNNIRYLGYVSEDQLTYLYSHAMFLAMPSLFEGFGLPLLEAMARGTPALTSNCSSMPEVVGDTGLLVDPLNVASIRDGLLKLIENNEYRHELGRLAILNSKRYNWDYTAEKTLKIFDEALRTRTKFLEN